MLSASQTETQDSKVKSAHENLQKEHHSTLKMAYHEIARDCQNQAITTRSAAQGDQTSIYANSQA